MLGEGVLDKFYEDLVLPKKDRRYPIWYHLSIYLSPLQFF